ncbi:uncharacterized protein VTP21DRAFT_1478 [Calcarisporiella thermophila]|uniref:uncharacterized protein n=1 Tax=Calcarisporiella thermophila TaxID=911321 RepID=UPI0037427E91
MNAEAKLINSFVNRIRVPINEGRSLEALENDRSFQQTLSALVDVAQYRLPQVAKNLVAMLENISQHTVPVSSEEVVAPEVLQSQYIILNILSVCMGHHWRWYRESTAHVSEAPEQQANIPQRRLEDPPALEESLVKSIINVILRVINQTTISEEVQNSYISIGSPFVSFTSMSERNQTPAKHFYAPLCGDIHTGIHRSASSILFYLSASNWGVVFAKIKSKIKHLSSTTDEWPDTSELKLLEYACLDQKRLSAVLQELSSTFLHLKRPAQPNMGLVLRKSIWNWIEVYPAEFAALYQSQQRLDGRPEVLFDISNSLADNNRRKGVFWPLQTTLLLLCPDILASAVMNVGTSGRNKKVQFLEALKKSMRSSRLGDVASVCYVSICKASTYVNQSERSILRHIVSDVENDLREKLLDPQRVQANSDNFVDQSLMIDCLTSLYLLNPRTALRSFVSYCMLDSAPIVFKLVLSKTCLALSDEQQRLPWNPSLSQAYSTLASPIRKLFQEGLNRDRAMQDISLTKKIVTSDKKQRKMLLEEAGEKLDLLLTIFKLYLVAPQLALWAENSEHYEELRRLTHGISLCLHDPVTAVRTSAAELLLQLHSPAYIDKWGSEDAKMSSFWTISSQVLLAVARKILDYKEREEGTKHTLELLLKLLVRRNEFLKSCREQASHCADIPERLASTVALEIALLVLLCSPDNQICSMTLSCFGHLCTEASLTEELDDTQRSQLTIVENFNVYSELARVGGPVTGRRALQKKIRRLLRQMTRPTPGNLAAWEEAWKRWRVLTQSLVRSLDDIKEEGLESPSSSTPKKPAFYEKLRGQTIPRYPSSSGLPSRDAIDEDKASEWQNYTGFLAALSECCVAVANPPSPRTSNYDGRRLGGSPHDSGQMVEKFVQEMVDLLVSDNVFVREVSKETLGSDLPPALYNLLFGYFESAISVFFDPDSEAVHSERSTLFVDQAISVMKLILDQLRDPAEHVFIVDVGSLVLNFARYLHRLSHSQPTVIRTKIKMCQLCEMLILKKECVTLNQEVTLRNRLLEIVVEWTSDFSKSDGQPNVQEVLQQERLYRDLDLACLKAIVVLLQKLPLIPTNNEGESDNSQAKSKLFYKYFSLFVKLLNRCRLESIDTTTSQNARNNQDLQMLLSKSKEYVRDLAPLKEQTILALSNLLSANVDAGLKYTLLKGYHEDTRTRTAFMQVLTNMLNLGTGFDALAMNFVSSRAEKYEKLIDIIVGSDLKIALTLCNVCPVSEIDTLALLLLKVFNSRKQTMLLLKTVIEREVANTESESELFRRNSMATRMLSAFARLYGTDYMRTTLQPILQELYTHPEQYSFELDPAKVPNPEDINRNVANLKRTTQQFLDVICTTTNRVPRSFREVCSYLATAVGERFPEAKYTAVGGFIFLRFFCPAIVAPEVEQLVKPPSVSKEFRRGLTLITKVIQNLANNVLFGAKEPYMTVLNDFLSNNIYRVTAFLRDISVSPAVNEEFKTETPEPCRLEESDQIRLHWFLLDNLEKIGREISGNTRMGRLQAVSNSRPTSMSSTSDISQPPTTSREAFDRLAALLSEIGGPTEAPKKEAFPQRTFGFSSKNHLYQDFMRRNANRNIDEITKKGVFYLGGVSRERRPVFVYVARRVNADSFDFEGMIYYIFKVVGHHMEKPFDILIDCTCTSETNAVPHQWLNQLFQYMHFSTITNIGKIYFFGINTNFKKFLQRRLPRSIPILTSRKVVFAANLRELYEHIPPSEVHLPKSTQLMDSEPAVTFSPANKILSRSSSPVIIKVGTEWVHIISARKEEIFLGLSAVVNDVFHVSQIVDAAPTPGASDENEFYIKYHIESEPRGVYALSSPKRPVIVQAIRSAKARYQLSQPNEISERHIRPDDVPGTLLNMALLNLGSEDPSLRLAAYDLLHALVLAFDFEGIDMLLSVKGLCIPANSTNFVVSVSERLAATQPQLTLEFLNECFVGLSKSSTRQQHLCLEYMSSWLPNLASFARPKIASPAGDGGMHVVSNQHNVVKVREIIRSLIELTVSQSEIYAQMQAKVWSVLGKVEELIPLVLDTLVQYAADHGVGSNVAEAVADTMVSLSSTAVRGKVMAKLRKCLLSTCLKPTRTLSEHPLWQEIAVLIRMNLLLSFNCRHHVQHFLPELCYIVSILVATGPSVVRSSIHGLVVNVIQTLCVSMPLEQEQLKRLHVLLAEFAKPKFRLLFGLNRSAPNALVISQESTNEVAETMALGSLESIVDALLQVISAGAPSIDMANAWRARWLGLVTSSAFQFNPAIQPRTFVVLGCLAKEDVDDDLLYQILVTLRGGLAMFNETDCNLVISIVMCLTNVVPNLQKDSRYLHHLFWLAMSLVEVGHVPIFTSALNLLQVVLRTLDGHGLFAKDGPTEMLLRLREPVSDIAQEIDATNGISFSTHFSFAVAATLLKGLKHPTTKVATQALLTTFVELEGKAASSEHELISSRTLGYLAALLPTAAKNLELRELLTRVNFPDVEVDYNSITPICALVFDRLDIPDNSTALLLVSLLVTMLNNAENEAERLFLYGMLAESAVAIPEVFSLVYGSLLMKMNHIINSNEVLPIQEAVKSILCTVVSDPVTFGGVASSTSTGRPATPGLAEAANTSSSTSLPSNKVQGSSESAIQSSSRPGSASSIQDASIRNSNSLSSVSTRTKATQLAYLQELGFQGILDCGSFSNVTKAQIIRNAQLTDALIEKMIA